MPMHPFNDDLRRRQRSALADRRSAEPEIIPPDADVSSGARAEAVFASRGVHIEVTRLGPLGIVVILLGAGMLGAFALLMLLGTVLVGAAVAGVVLAAALLSRLLRGPLRP
jgi:hypothetical protein